MTGRYSGSKPVAGQRHLKSTPRFGEVYWVDLPADFIKPEFGPPHPGIIIRGGRHLDDPHLIVPITSVDQGSRRYSHELSENPNPIRDRARVWAVCDHVYTISTERLRYLEDSGRAPKIVKLPRHDLFAIGKLVLEALRRLQDVVALGPPPAEPEPAVARPKGPNTLSLKPRP